MSMQDEGRPVAPQGRDCAGPAEGAGQGRDETRGEAGTGHDAGVPRDAPGTPHPTMGRRDWAALAAAAALAVAWCVRLRQAYLGMSAIFWMRGGADLAILVAGFFVALIALRGGVRTLSRGQVALLAATAGCALVPALNACVELREYNAFVLGACCLVAFYSLCGARVFDALGPVGWARSMGHFVRSQLAHATLPLRSLCGASGRTARDVALGLMAALALLVVVVPLLASADGRLAVLAERAFGPSLDNLPGALARVARTVLLALLGFSLLLAGMRGEARPVAVRTAARPAPTVTVAIVLAAADLLYLAFDLLQASYLFGGAPLGVGYAEYAREGFFQLVAVAAINLALLAAVLHVRRGAVRSAVLAALQLALVGLTAVLLASAAWRMALYVGEYGLTLLRAMTCAGMAAVAGLLVVAAVRVQHEEFPATAWGTGVVLVAWLAFALSRPAAWVADYDVNGYLTGTIERVDVGYLAELSPEETQPALDRLAAGRPDLAEDLGTYVDLGATLR